MNKRLALQMKQEIWIGNMNPYKNCRFQSQFLIEAGNVSIFSITKHAIHSFLKLLTKIICIFILKTNLTNAETFFQSWNTQMVIKFSQGNLEVKKYIKNVNWPFIWLLDPKINIWYNFPQFLTLFIHFHFIISQYIYWWYDLQISLVWKICEG